MAQFSHPNVVQMVGFVRPTSSTPCYLVVELCSDGALFDMLVAKRQTHLTLWKMTTGIAGGMVYLHDKKFVHRDLATRNVLVDKGVPKISE